MNRTQTQWSRFILSCFGNRYPHAWHFLNLEVEHRQSSWGCSAQIFQMEILIKNSAWQRCLEYTSTCSHVQLTWQKLSSHEGSALVSISMELSWWHQNLKRGRLQTSPLGLRIMERWRLQWSKWWATACPCPWQQQHLTRWWRRRWGWTRWWQCRSSPSSSLAGWISQNWRGNTEKVRVNNHVSQQASQMSERACVWCFLLSYFLS